MQIPTPTAEDQFLLQFVATGALKVNALGGQTRHT